MKRPVCARCLVSSVFWNAARKCWEYPNGFVAKQVAICNWCGEKTPLPTEAAHA